MISEAVRERVRTSANNRCGYCLTDQRYAMQVLEIEHIIPKASGGSDEEDNLWLACRLCNNAKGIQTSDVDPITQNRVTLFNPRTETWSNHFSWTKDGTQIIGRTERGRATIIALNLNNEIALVVRRNWVKAGWHPPEE